MTAQAARAGTPWGVGWYVDRVGADHQLEVSEAAIERETAVAVRRLTEWGFRADDIVLVVAGVAEAVQFAPFQRAARALGGVSCTAEPAAPDAPRTAAFLEQYSLRAVIGLNAAVLDGLEANGVASVLQRCPNLLVRDDAVARVAAYGLAPATIHVVGPTVAVECPQRAGAHVGADAWTVGTDDGELWVEPAPGRDLAIARIGTRRRARVDAEPCICGSDDPRIALA